MQHGGSGQPCFKIVILDRREEVGRSQDHGEAAVARLTALRHLVCLANSHPAVASVAVSTAEQDLEEVFGCITGIPGHGLIELARVGTNCISSICLAAGEWRGPVIALPLIDGCICPTPGGLWTVMDALSDADVVLASGGSRGPAQRCGVLGLDPKLLDRMRDDALSSRVARAVLQRLIKGWQREAILAGWSELVPGIRLRRICLDGESDRQARCDDMDISPLEATIVVDSSSTRNAGTR